LFQGCDMKLVLLLSFLLTVILLTVFLLRSPILEKKQRNVSPSRNKTSMKLTSPYFDTNAMIPEKYTCDGENVNPALSFEDVPSEAKSLVLIVEDPDAPSKTWIHWVVYHIDPATKEIAENSVPQGVDLGMTDFGKPSYGGPCPPSGQTHHYYFKLYALDEKLQIEGNPDADAVKSYMMNHILAEAQLVGLYKRQQ
jgi:Raf kinase inhibitor-like YbhB/YbcL family protein